MTLLGDETPRHEPLLGDKTPRDQPKQNKTRPGDLTIRFSTYDTIHVMATVRDEPKLHTTNPDLATNPHIPIPNFTAHYIATTRNAIQRSFTWRHNLIQQDFMRLDKTWRHNHTQLIITGRQNSTG